MKLVYYMVRFVSFDDGMETKAEGALPLTEQTQVRRLAHYQTTERSALYSVLDEGLAANVAIVRDSLPVALPVGFARDGDSILLHGSTGSDFFRRLAAGVPLCITVTHLDGLAYARSLFDSSMRYRAAVIHGVATALPDAEKEAALVMLAEHLMPGRAGEVRPILQRELAATMVLRVPLTTASVKDNSSSLIEEPGDGEDRSVWAGLLPLRIVAGEPEPSAETANAPVDYSVLATRNHLNQL